MKSISRVFLVSILLVMSSFIILDNSTRSNNIVDVERNHILAQTTLLEDSGFESGGFSVWTNELDTATNTIQSTIVHSGSYALRMESVLSTPDSWRAVHQVPTIETSLAENASLSAAIYPLVTGNTCGEYGQASVVVFFYDSVAAAGRRLIYVWSGYDFPGTDTSVNISRGYFEFYQWSTSTWHILERDLLVDYTACYGAPSDPSAVNITRLNIYNHYSNGAPGTFYADDIQITSNLEPQTTTTWHDDCSSADGWTFMNESSGFDPKHTSMDSGTLSSTGGYLVVTGIADPVTERKGPLFIKELGDSVSINAIEMFQAEVQFTYLSDTFGFLSVYLFDENKQKAVMLRLHDAWAASESHPESVYFSPGEAGDGTVHDEILFGSWSGFLRFRYDESTGSLVGELDDGTPNSATLKTSGNFDPYRAIKYIGIQWSRHPGANYNGDTYRLLDVQLTYDYRKTVSWYHDCSNATGFTYNDSWNINWMTWDIQNGTFASDGSTLSVTNVPTGVNYHGPVFEYELQETLRIRDIENFSAILDADNSLSSYVGYQVLMLGDVDRNPVLFFSFGDGWADYSQGAFGMSYVFENGSRTGYGSGYPITWTSFSGTMNVSFAETGLMSYVEGVGQELISGLSEADFDRVIKYVAIASARYGSDPMFQLLVDEIYLNYRIANEPSQPSINDVEDFGYEAGSLENVIVWNIANFIPDSYELYRDGELLSSGVWPGGTLLEVNVDNLALGEYNYTIVVFGEVDISVSDSVIITVVDTTAPILNHPSDIIDDIGATNIQIAWQPTDLFPFNYVIYLNGTQVSSGTWTSGQNQTYTLVNLIERSYNITIVVWDTSGNYATDTVFISIDEGLIPSNGDYLAFTISIGSIAVVVIIIGLICRSKSGSPAGNPNTYDW